MTKKHTIKVSYNITQVTFNLYNNEGGKVSVKEESETILYKRDRKYLENYLKKKYKDYLTVELIDFQHKTFKSLIPFSLVLEHGSEV